MELLEQHQLAIEPDVVVSGKPYDPAVTRVEYDVLPADLELGGVKIDSKVGLQPVRPGHLDQLVPVVFGSQWCAGHISSPLPDIGSVLGARPGTPPQPTQQRR